MLFTPSELNILEQAAGILDKHIKAAGPVLESPEAVRYFLRVKLEHRASEVFALLLLDTRHTLIEYRELFFGTIDAAQVYPREVVKAALAVNAAAVILVHNHPSGNPDPSAADIALTARLRDILAVIDVRVLDHFVVGKTIVSLAEQGKI